MKKRIFSILLCLCIVMMQFPTAVLAQSYESWEAATAEGVTLTPDTDTVTINSIEYTYSGDISNDGLDLSTITTPDSICFKAGEGYVLYNPATTDPVANATLELHNATIITNSGTVFNLPDDEQVDIIVLGDNVLTAAGEDVISMPGMPLSITGDGNLTIESPLNYGISSYNDKDIIIDIRGNLAFNTNNTPIYTNQGDITITAKSITSEAGGSICGNNVSITATDGDISLTGKDVSVGNLVDSSGKVTLAAEKGAATVECPNADLALFAKEGVTISALNDMTINSNGDAVYNWNETENNAISITSKEGNININGGIDSQEIIANESKGPVILNAAKDITINGIENSYAKAIYANNVDITAGEKLSLNSDMGIVTVDEGILEPDGSLIIRANEVSIEAIGGDGILSTNVSITNPEGGNCSEVYIYGGFGGRNAISASDLTIKADEAKIISDGSANSAINARGDVSIGDGGMIVGNIYVDGTTSISENILMVDANYGDASAGLDLRSTSPTISTYFKVGDGYVLYTPKEGETSATLILHEAEILTDSDYAVELKEETVIKLEGTNYITNSKTNGVGLFASYDGQECPVTIQGGSGDSLTISAWQCTRVGALTISGASINMNGSVHGMLTEGDVLIENSAQVTVTGGEFGFALSAGNGEVVYDILTAPGLSEDERADALAQYMFNLTLTGGSTLTVNGDADISGHLTVSDDSTLSVEGSAFVCGNLTVGSGSTINKEEGKYFRVYLAKSITNDGTIVNNGTFVLPYSYTGEQVQALNIPGKVELYDFVNDKSKVYVNGGFYVPGAILYHDDGLDLSIDTPTEPTYYKLNNNAEGYIIYTPASEDEDAVLILHNVDNAGDLSGGITLPDEAITLHIEGNNYFFEIYASNNITISGDGLLNSVIINSNASAVLTVGSNATLNAEYREGVNKIIFYGTRGYNGTVDPATDLELSPGAVLEVINPYWLEFMEGTTLSNLTIGEGASIINNSYITLPMGTTAEQIAALPLSGTGAVRVATAYDGDGRAINWNTYNNHGVAVMVIGTGGSGLDLTDGDHSSSTIENNGYEWDSSTGTLTLGDNAYVDGSLILPDDAIVNITGNNTIGGYISFPGTTACNVIFSGTGNLEIGDGISGSGNNGDILTIQGGAHVTAGNSIFLGASGGWDGTLNVTGEGTSLSVSSSYGYGVMCDTVNLQNGASLTVNADSVGVQALSGGVNITGGATLTTNCEYGVYITDGMLYVEPGSKLITNGSIAPFCVEDTSNLMEESESVSLPGIPAGTQITSVIGTDPIFGATYWSLVPTGGSLGVSNENNDTVTLSGAVQGIVTFQRISSPTPSGGGQTTSYTLNFDTKGGSKIIDLTKTSGTVIDLSAYKPIREGFDFEGWYSDEKLTEKLTEVKLTQNTTIYAKWIEKSTKANNPFTDVAEDSYYYDAVLWAVKEGVTSGTSATAFSPNMVCTRAQMVTFLWRTIGSPEPKSAVCSFNDVSKDTYYYKAVLWAEENGVTVGTSVTTFSPEDKVTRGQAMSFLWRLAGRPASTSVNPFADVPKGIFYYDAILWAVENGITYGTSQGSFSPDDSCLRAQIVTFLYRYMED